MKIAVIDIGTNTVLLLVAQVDPAGVITTLVYEQRVPRLGRGVDKGRNLHPDSMARVIETLKEYATLMTPHAPDCTVVCGTSAVRDAHNRTEFAEQIKSATGFALEILSGDDEALWTYRGAISGMPGSAKATVVDIGGGSTEITTGNSNAVHKKISLDIGSVRLTERCFHHDPPTHPELEAAIEIVENELARPKDFGFAESILIGVAGTATSLAILAQGLRDFRIDAVKNYRLTQETVYHLFRTLRAMTVEQIDELAAVMKGRSDVIIAGTLILREVMAHYKFNEMVVSERGVRYGLVLREWERIHTHQREHP